MQQEGTPMTIAEVAKKYGLTTDTLRYYERIGLIPHVPRSSGGIREYGEEDCRWVEFARCMRSAGLPVEILVEYIALWQQGEQTSPARKTLLIEQRDLLAGRIDKMKETLERLDKKIENYESRLMAIEKDLT
jgi:MerR family transcriptional regulator, aldehyde-responsive regulator